MAGIAVGLVGCNGDVAPITTHLLVLVASIFFGTIGVWFSLTLCHQRLSNAVTRGRIGPGEAHSVRLPEKQLENGMHVDEINENWHAAMRWHPRAFLGAWLGDKELLETGILADVTIICGTREFKAHSVILASRCKWFRTALMGRFREAQTKVIEFPELHPDAIKIVLNWIYTHLDKCDGLSCLESWDYHGSIMTMFHTWRAAHYLMLDDLTEKTEQVFPKHLGYFLNRLFSLAKGEDGYDEIVLDLERIINHVYELNNDTLRESLVDTIIWHDPKVMEIASIQSLISEVAEFREDLLKGTVRRVNQEKDEKDKRIKELESFLQIGSGDW
ncbi:BTB/POZ protein [Xylariaceae sp. FL1272]|nr:BTB/POZ protein [Xylariaceae sp. FL1272]